MNYSNNCTQLTEASESCAKAIGNGMFAAYPDPGTGSIPWTIGFGATGGDVTRGTVWSQAQCNTRLAADLTRAALEVSRAIGTTPTTQNQFDALVDFQYNTGALFSSTLLRLHNAKDYAGAAAQFGRWIHAGGHVLNGLITRRAKEKALYNQQ